MKRMQMAINSLGDGTIGVKDDKNNDDFDDLILSLDLQALQTNKKKEFHEMRLL